MCHSVRDRRGSCSCRGSMILPPLMSARAKARGSGGRGMTLIEVLVASVLLGAGVAGLISVATLAMRNQQHTELRATALCLAQEKLAEVELVGAHAWMLGHPTHGTRPIGGAVFTWTIRIEQLAVGELFSVQIELGWSGSGKGGSVELETWLNDYEAVTGGERTALPGR